MARPQKSNAEYFSHDADMRNDPKVKALRRKFKHTGYAVWNYLLETLTDSDHFTISWDEVGIELLAGDYDIEVSELTQIVDYCVKIGLLQIEGSELYSSNHRKRLAVVVEFRKQQSNNGKKGGNPNFKKGRPNPYYNQEKDNPKITDGYDFSRETLPEDTKTLPEDKQSKVKYSKVKNSKEEIYNISLSDAHASLTERETFFEIFFFKNFRDPSGEVERFCANYESSGWVRSNGQSVTDRIALAKTWTQEDKQASPRFLPNFLNKWELLFNDMKQKRPDDVKLLIAELDNVKIDDVGITLVCRSKSLPNLIEQHIDYFKPFFATHFPNRRLIYRYSEQ